MNINDNGVVINHTKDWMKSGKGLKGISVGNEKTDRAKKRDATPSQTIGATETRNHRIYQYYSTQQSVVRGKSSKTHSY